MTTTSMETSDRTAATTRIALPAARLGIGFGGLVDVVAFRQVLQWHHLLSNAGDDRLGLDPAARRYGEWSRRECAVGRVVQCRRVAGAPHGARDAGR